VTDTRRRSAAPRAKRTEMPTLGTGPVAQRLAALRAIAQDDPGHAQEETWGWVRELGDRRAAATLDELFELGSPPKDLDGPADGILVTPLINPIVDLPVRLLTRLWMPWRGKIFDADTGTGINRLTANSILPLRLVWPLYRPRTTPEGSAAFEFVSGPEPGRLPPRVPVLKIDYQPVAKNPQLIIRQIRDELVELVPDTYLGRVLFRLPMNRFTNIGYFALRQPAIAAI
jgi:hypothetical protein